MKNRNNSTSKFIRLMNRKSSSVIDQEEKIPDTVRSERSPIFNASLPTSLEFKRYQEFFNDACFGGPIDW